MRVIVGKYPPREAGADDVWIATLTRQIGRGARSVRFDRCNFNSSEQDYTGFRIAVILISRALTHGPVPYDDIFAFAYDNPKDGGPSSRSIQTILAQHLRPKLRPLGIVISGRYGYGDYQAVICG